MKLGMQVGLGPGHTVLDGDPAPSTERGTATPDIRNLWVQALPASVYSTVHVYCSQTAVWIKMKLGMDVGIGLHQIVLNGDPAPLPQRGTAPSHQKRNFVHVCCGQTTGWIKMQLGIEVGLSRGHTVLDRDPAPPAPKGHSPPLPIFIPCLLWPNGGMNQYATW